MTDDLIALARRAVACKGWKWMPGMVMLWPSGVVRGYWLWARPMIVGDDGAVNWWEGDPPTEHADGAWQSKAIPDLSDAATVGCLLARVREAWGQPEMCCGCSIAPGWGVYLALVREAWGQDEAFCYREQWCVETPQKGYVYGATEADALVAALEAAP